MILLILHTFTLKCDPNIMKVSGISQQCLQYEKILYFIFTARSLYRWMATHKCTVEFVLL